MHCANLFKEFHNFPYSAKAHSFILRVISISICVFGELAPKIFFPAWRSAIVCKTSLLQLGRINEPKNNQEQILILYCSSLDEKCSAHSDCTLNELWTQISHLWIRILFNTNLGYSSGDQMAAFGKKDQGAKISCKCTFQSVLLRPLINCSVQLITVNHTGPL
jgi:hypothetical protein